MCKFWPIKKELESWMYNNIRNHLFFLQILKGNCALAKHWLAKIYTIIIANFSTISHSSNLKERAESSDVHRERIIQCQVWHKTDSLALETCKLVFFLLFQNSLYNFSKLDSLLIKERLSPAMFQNVSKVKVALKS